jgi:hypothetical protein
MVDTGILISETTVPIGTKLYTGMVFIRFSTKSLFIVIGQKTWLPQVFLITTIQKNNIL